MVKRVLLAEDNMMNRKLAELGLRSYESDVANDGQEAVELYDKNEYDVILMDVHMPRLNGIEATLEIRRIEAARNQNPPAIILALTADWGESVAKECLGAGMNDYIPKPFRPDNIPEMIEELYHKHNNIQPCGK